MKKFIAITCSALLLAITAYWVVDDEKKKRYQGNLLRQKSNRPLQSNIRQSKVTSNQRTSVRSMDMRKPNLTQRKVASQEFGHFRKNKGSVVIPVKNFFSQADSITINQQSYFITNELYTIQAKHYTSSMGRQVLTHLGQVFFHSEGNTHGRPALLNQNNHRLAVMTGRVNITSPSPDKIKDLPFPDGTTIDHSMGHLNIYSINIPQGHDLLATVEQLSEQANLPVELEIIEEVEHAQ